jgi:hypothetical protein
MQSSRDPMPHAGNPGQLLRVHGSSSPGRARSQRTTGAAGSRYRSRGSPNRRTVTTIVDSGTPSARAIRGLVHRRRRNGSIRRTHAR